MSPFWHPIEAVYLREPRVLASPALVRMVLTAEERAEFVYAGDRMWPALRHGQALEVRPVAAPGPRRGDVLIAQDGGVLEAVRVRSAGQFIRVTADADPAVSRLVPASDIVGVVLRVPPRRGVGPMIVRLWLDLREAIGGRPDAADEPATTVREKYDSQAVHYARLDGEALDPGLRNSLEARLARGSRVLVAGSGVGREAFALEAVGYEVRGIDFSEAMVRAARVAAAQQGSRSTFTSADLRTHEEAPESIDAIVFTYDVYSLIPGIQARIAALRRMRTWLRPGGFLFLSARRARGARDLSMLSLQRIVRRLEGGGGEWGESHTRWLDSAGRLRRSFVHVFTDRQLDRETSTGGFRRVSWTGGHGVYVTDGAMRAVGRV